MKKQKQKQTVPQEYIDLLEAARAAVDIWNTVSSDAEIAKWIDNLGEKVRIIDDQNEEY